ncbi:protein TolQ [Desulfobacterales bacterium RS19-109]|uniref:Protein TolQ n=2 Tax=Thiovibrio frasassiensis TaxID=2984131 RepID=A0A9X4MJ16_9BACT|nr:protein TolQ [Thiovibrio frasassiensis]
MFLGAGLTVKFVMIMLLGISLTSWYIVFQKFSLYKQARIESEEFLEAFWQSKNLSEALRFANNLSLCPEANIFRTGYHELQKLGKTTSGSRSADETLETRLAGMEPLKRALRKAENLESTRLSQSLPFLATAGSTAPFIGLFGTVWGIMTSFHEIGMRGSASLAVVAPGVSEALVVTAAGLAVAIPAVVFYNYYSNQMAEIESRMHSFSVDFLNLVERDFISRQG